MTGEMVALVLHGWLAVGVILLAGFGALIIAIPVLILAVIAAAFLVGVIRMCVRTLVSGTRRAVTGLIEAVRADRATPPQAPSHDCACRQAAEAHLEQEDVDGGPVHESDVIAYAPTAGGLGMTKVDGPESSASARNRLHVL